MYLNFIKQRCCINTGADLCADKVIKIHYPTTVHASSTRHNVAVYFAGYAVVYSPLSTLGAIDKILLSIILGYSN